jgi:hypothetical protein
MLNKNVFALFAVMIIFFFNQPAFASTKYDRIIEDPGWKQIMGFHQNNINKIMLDYLNLVVNKNDLKNLIKQGELDKEKAKYVEENLDGFTKYMQVVAGKLLFNQSDEITDEEFIYVTGVIKSQKAAKTPTEQEIEKTSFRGFLTYRYWETWREKGFLKKEVAGEIDKMYKTLQKKK